MCDTPVAGAQFHIWSATLWGDALMIPLSYRTPYGSGQKNGLRLVRLGKDGSVQAIAEPEGMEGLLIHHSIVPLRHGWLFVPKQVRANEAMTLRYSAFDGSHLSDPVTIPISNDTPTELYRKLSQERSDFCYPSNGGAPVVAMPIAYGGETAGVAFLQLETDLSAAHWVDWPKGRRSGGGTQALVELHPDDYPKYSGYNGFAIEVQATAMRGDTPQIMSRGGLGRSTKYGTPGTHLAELGVDGRTTRTLHYDDFSTGPLAQKNRAREGHFVKGGSSFVIRSVFKATDPWAGAECLVDLETAQLQVLDPPRGCKGMRLLDVQGDIGWFWRAEKEGTATVWRMQVGPEG